MDNKEQIKQLIAELNAMPFIYIYNLNERRYDYDSQVLKRIEQGKEKAKIGEKIQQLRQSGYLETI